MLLAAISNQEKGICRNYMIQISGVETNYFIDQHDVEALLKKAAGGELKGQRLAGMNLKEMESALEKSNWISNAVVYVDNQEVLHVKVTEKEPVARIFTVNGNSYYIDKNGDRMPLSDKLSAKVPVITGVPDARKKNEADSLLWSRLSATANYIMHQPFWMAQVAQLNITPDRQFEMIPVVGNHVVKMGEGDDIEKQFTRLLIFYKEVLSKTGFDRYKVINVQYKGQVVASRNPAAGSMDSVQQRRSVEELLRLSRQSATDTVAGLLPKPAAPLEPDTQDEAPERDDNPAVTTNSNPASVNTINNRTPAPVPKAADRQPRAVMPKRNNGTQNNRN